MLLASAAVAAVLGGGVDAVTQPVFSSASQEPVLQSSAGYLRPPVVLATTAGILVRNEAEAEASAVPTPGPTPEAAPEPTPEPSPEPQPAFFVYTVQPGDTIASIAASFGIDQDYILWNNADLVDDPDLLLVGQGLQIPSVNGIVYNVTLGDTLSDIAVYYQIDVQSILAFLPNEIPSPDTVIEGMVLVLPGAVPPPPPIPAAVDVVAATAPSTPVPLSPEPPPPAPAAGYVWPWYGNITSYFGEPRGGGAYHLAIDIDGYGSYGAAVVAAASGQVVLAAWDDYGLGYHVIIQHDDGSRTTYAHLSDIYVVQGQYVSQGEAIGALGCSGYCTGTHLHFELLIDGVPVDPLVYLP